MTVIVLTCVKDHWHVTTEVFGDGGTLFDRMAELVKDWGEPPLVWNPLSTPQETFLDICSKRQGEVWRIDFHILKEPAHSMANATNNLLRSALSTCVAEMEQPSDARPMARQRAINSAKAILNP